uniref:Uncharacterized protein n=1 Tax=Romanomermis culicivorax TaxID=13658 RepID=A0A915KDC2_ROMCU
MQQPSTLTNQRSYSGAASSSYKSPLSKSQSLSLKSLNSTFRQQNQQYSSSTSSGSARRHQKRDDAFSNPAPYGGMAEAKSEEVFEGALSDPAVEAKEARTKAKMEVRPEAKARGDTIEEGLQGAIDGTGSSMLLANKKNHFSRTSRPGKGVSMQLDGRPTACHNMQTIQLNPKLTQFGTKGN